tara:strand:- start:627 stop:1001 length:375 start_codon:yes stop_codon:yes gene_type:complete
MRLYTNDKGAWAGTQADARKDFGKDWREVDVPTAKPDLLAFLNNYGVKQSDDAVVEYMDAVNDFDTSPSKVHPQSCSANRDVREAASLNKYDVADVVLNCPKNHLASALAAIISRLNDQLGEVE